MGAAELFIRKTKDKTYKFEAYDRQGRTARGITERAAKNAWHMRYDLVTPDVGFNMNTIEKKL